MKRAISKLIPLNFYNLMSLLLLIISSIFITVFFIYHYQVITDSYQVELREGAVVSITDALVKGVNPYAYHNQPELTNVYGIFYNFLVYPLAKVFGSTLLIHRIASAFFILLILVILFTYLRVTKVERSLIFGGISIIYGSLLYMAPPCAKLDSLALFLFLCSLLIPSLLEYSILSLTISGICLLLVFFSKMSYILGIPSLALFLFLFHSKVKGILFFFVTSFALILSCYFMSSLYPTYMDNSFFNHINISGDKFSWALKQFYYFFAYNFILTIAFILLVILFCYQYYEGFSRNKYHHLLKMDSRHFIDMTQIRKPFLTTFKVEYEDYLFGLFVLLLLLKLGKHTGSFLVYYFSLLTPFFVIFVLFQIRELLKLKLLCQFLFILNIPFFYFLVLPPLGLNKEYYPNCTNESWKRLEDIVKTNSGVYNHPAITSIMIKNNRKVYNNGQSQYFVWGADRKSIYKWFFNDHFKIKERNSEFLKDLSWKIKEQHFSIIIKDADEPFLRDSELKEYYFINEIIRICMPFTEQEWDLEIWGRL